MAENDFNKPKVSPDVSKKLSDSPDVTLDTNKDIRESLDVVLTEDGLKNKDTISDGKVTKSQDSDHKENAPIQKPAEPAVKAPEKSRETILGDKGGTEKPGYKVPEGGVKGVTGERTQDAKPKDPTPEGQAVIDTQLAENAQDKVQSGQGAAEKAHADASRDVKEDNMKKLDSSKPDYSGGKGTDQVKKEENPVVSAE